MQAQKQKLGYDGVDCPMCGLQVEDTKDGDACPVCGPVKPMLREFPVTDRFPVTEKAVPIGVPASFTAGIANRAPWQEGGNQTIDLQQKAAEKVAEKRKGK